MSYKRTVKKKVVKKKQATKKVVKKKTAKKKKIEPLFPLKLWVVRGSSANHIEYYLKDPRENDPYDSRVPGGTALEFLDKLVKAEVDKGEISCFTLTETTDKKFDAIFVASPTSFNYFVTENGKEVEKVDGSSWVGGEFRVGLYKDMKAFSKTVYFSEPYIDTADTAVTRHCNNPLAKRILKQFDNITATLTMEVPIVRCKISFDKSEKLPATFLRYILDSTY